MKRPSQPFRKSRTSRSALSWWQLGAPVLLVAALASGVGAFLAQDILQEKTIVDAPAEPPTSEAIDNFMKAHSLLEYTTQPGDTLRSVAKKLRRSSEIDQIRADNPHLGKIDEGKELEPGTVLRIVYNGFELQELLGVEEAFDADVTEEAIPQEGMNDES